MRDVCIIAVGMIPFGKYPSEGIKDLTAKALKNLFGHSPVAQSEIEAAWMSNAGWGMSTGQHCIRGQVALGPIGIGEIPIMNVENACGGGSSAFHGAYLGIAAGAYDVALAVGAEKTFVPRNASPEQKKKGFSSFLAGTDVEVTTKIIEKMRAEAERKRAELEAAGELEKGKGGGERSPFMDIYSIAARSHMERYGSTQEQLAIIAAKNHYHGSLNPDAQYRMDMTVQQALEDRLVSHPLTRAMCAPMGDGAAAALLVSGEYLQRLDEPRPVRVRASVLTSGSTRPGHNMAKTCSEKAYELAGVGPGDIGTAEVPDATAFGNLRMTENLGMGQGSDEEKEAMSPAWIAPIVTWLVSDEAASVTGKVFESSGRVLAVAEGWVRGPSVDAIDDPTQLGPVVADLVANARLNSGMDGMPGGFPQPQGGK